MIKMHSSTNTPLPIDKWSADMQTAIDQICEIGLLTLHTHREASDKAAAVADQWHLESRLDDEHAALRQLFDRARLIVEAIEDTRRRMRADDISAAMRDCANAIEENVPHITQALLTVRHSALDLLRWTQGSAKIEGSDLPDRYRASYAKLIAYTPIFKPFLESMQHELLALNKGPDHRPDVKLLLSALSRYNAVADSARSFVKSVVEPRLDLVFHDTDTFHQDWQTIAAEEQGHLATEFNDCCQLLLYEPSEFRRRVESIPLQVAEGMEASLFALPVDCRRILFTVDEDPLFQQMTVTLLRVVHVDEFDTALDLVTSALYLGLSED